jgi:hypothetical protein
MRAFLEKEIPRLTRATAKERSRPPSVQPLLAQKPRAGKTEKEQTMKPLKTTDGRQALTSTDGPVVTAFATQPSTSKLSSGPTGVIDHLDTRWLDAQSCSSMPIARSSIGSASWPSLRMASSMPVASASSLLWTAASARSSAFLSRATRRSVMAVSAVPIACSYRALAPKTKPASQAATKARQMTKNAGELEKYEARWARRSNGPRRSASPRSMGCLSDISRLCGEREGLLWWTLEQPSVERRPPRGTNKSIYRIIQRAQSLLPGRICDPGGKYTWGSRSYFKDAA